jgi:hypothetical protein
MNCWVIQHHCSNSHHCCNSGLYQCTMNIWALQEWLTAFLHWLYTSLSLVKDSDRKRTRHRVTDGSAWKGWSWQINHHYWIIRHQTYCILIVCHRYINLARTLWRNACIINQALANKTGLKDQRTVHNFVPLTDRKVWNQSCRLNSFHSSYFAL